tara:strand:- start:644 stop:1150 length:507 start_codon:yes stop_codon:yes gene_type:complete
MVAGGHTRRELVLEVEDHVIAACEFCELENGPRLAVWICHHLVHLLEELLPQPPYWIIATFRVLSSVASLAFGTRYIPMGGLLVPFFTLLALHRGLTGFTFPETSLACFVLWCLSIPSTSFAASQASLVQHDFALLVYPKTLLVADWKMIAARKWMPVEWQWWSLPSE